MKIHGLPPTLREKTRYLLCKVEAEKEMSFETVQKSIRSSIQHYVGIKGLAETGAYCVQSHSRYPYVVIRCTAKQLLAVKQSLQFLPLFCEGSIATIRTSGMLSNVIPPSMTSKEARTGNTKYAVKLCKAQIIN
jgi:RNase P/RNase MRP subunit POP5